LPLGLLLLFVAGGEGLLYLVPIIYISLLFVLYLLFGTSISEISVVEPPESLVSSSVSLSLISGKSGEGWSAGSIASVKLNPYY
jgi:hypothetical protein